MPLGVQAPCCPETRSQRHRLEASGLSRSRGAGSGRVPFQPPQHDCPPVLRSPWWWPEDTRAPRGHSPARGSQGRVMEVDAVPERAAEVRQEAVDALPHQAPPRVLGRSLGGRECRRGLGTVTEGRTGPRPRAAQKTLQSKHSAPFKK